MLSLNFKIFKKLMENMFFNLFCIFRFYLVLFCSYFYFSFILLLVEGNKESSLWFFSFFFYLLWGKKKDKEKFKKDKEVVS